MGVRLFASRKNKRKFLGSKTDSVRVRLRHKKKGLNLRSTPFELFIRWTILRPSYLLLYHQQKLQEPHLLLQLVPLLQLQLQ